MAYTLGEVLSGIFPELPEDAEEKLHRTDVVERPNEKVNLCSIAREGVEVCKTQYGPTDDLFEIRIGYEGVDYINMLTEGYLIWCQDTKQLWYAPNELCLNKNFVYRDDLIIYKLTGDVGAALEFYEHHGRHYNPGILRRKTCYILDIPGNETYEVYYDSSYPAVHYGKATPQGMFVHKYQDRFHRDMAIISLDKLYSSSSGKNAAAFTARKLNSNQAIIISDGAWLKEQSVSAYYYIDDGSVIKMVEGTAPSDVAQAVLISEINAAYNALMTCKCRNKKQIMYYYDNTSILNVFKNNRTECIDEVKRYKELLENMASEGYRITFNELHPKTDDDKSSLNKALVFFHNSCDSECRVIADIIKKDYKSYIAANDTGTDYNQFRQEIKAKQGKKNNQQNGYRGKSSGRARR